MESGSASPTCVDYRVRVLLFAGQPNWDLLATLTPLATPKRPKPVIERTLSLP